MNAFRSALRKTFQESDEERQTVSRTVSLHQTRKSCRNAQAAPDFGLDSSQHAQITRAIFEQEQFGVAILNLDGTIQEVNEALARLLGYELPDLVGKSIEEFARGVDGSTDFLSTTDVHRTTPFQVNRLVRKSGEAIECLVDSSVICDDSGTATNFLIFVSDARAKRSVEERNRFESELYGAQTLQTLGTLAGGVAHDFNNALEVIIGFASLARVRLAPDDPLHEPLKIIEESATGAAGLARQLLDVAKTNDADRKTIDVGELISSVLTIITRTFDRRIRIENRIAPSLPRVKGFRNRLEHAILNLCINARDAMPQGGTLTIEITSENFVGGDKRLPASCKPGPHVRIAVHDSGSGMTAEVVEHIFVPLFTTKAPGRGSGLGLAMVDRVVKEEQGFVSVNSKPGEGSEFALYLPAVFTSASRPAPRTDQLASGRGTVLVVDDEPRVLEFLEKGLTRLGYKVIPAENGSQACEIYAGKSKEIDSVLLDMIMPGMNGLDTCAQLQNINPRVRIILSSGYSSGRVKRNALETSSVEFLEKPYTLEALSQMLRKIQKN